MANSESEYFGSASWNFQSNFQALEFFKNIFTFAFELVFYSPDLKRFFGGSFF